MTVNPSNVRSKFGTREDVLAELKRFNRDPFQEILADMIQAIPDDRILKLWAAKHPDKWASSLATLAKVAGFHDKLEIENNINVKIGGMGDADLDKMIADLQGEMKDVTPEAEQEKDPAEAGPPLLEYKPLSERDD